MVTMFVQVRVGIEKEAGLSPESKMVVLHDFTPCVDDELEVKRGQVSHHHHHHCHHHRYHHHHCRHCHLIVTLCFDDELKVMVS